MGRINLLPHESEWSFDMSHLIDQLDNSRTMLLGVRP
jgi:hypothetical protein